MMKSLSQITRGLTRNYCETKEAQHNAQSNSMLTEAAVRAVPADTLCISQHVFKFAGVGLQDVGTEGRTEVSKVFAALSLDPWHKGRRVDEENNPTTVRWIDMMRTYVDM